MPDYLDTPSIPLGDYGAIAAIVDPGGLTVRSVPMAVSTEAGTRGQTIYDFRPHQHSLPELRRLSHGRAVDVGVAVDGRRYVDSWISTLTGTGVHA